MGSSISRIWCDFAAPDKSQHISDIRVGTQNCSTRPERENPIWWMRPMRFRTRSLWSKVLHSGASTILLHKILLGYLLISICLIGYCKEDGCNIQADWASCYLPVTIKDEYNEVSEKLARAFRDCMQAGQQFG